MIDALLGQTLIQPELQDRLGRGGRAAVQGAMSRPSIHRHAATRGSHSRTGRSRALGDQVQLRHERLGPPQGMTAAP